MTNGSTTGCQRFVQNAWKKEFCSNCFKSKEDHASLPDKKPSAYNWKLYLQSSPKQGILKCANGQQSKKGKCKSANSVSFLNEESEIIGYGGDDFYYSDSDENEYEDEGNYYDDVVEDEEDANQTEELSDCCVSEDTEERKRLSQLTKSNTDFNSIPANLLPSQSRANESSSANSVSTSVARSDAATKTYSNLQLGKPLIDANGHKQTLKVSVEPFQSSRSGNGKENDSRKENNNEINSDKSSGNNNNNSNNSDDNNDDDSVINKNIINSIGKSEKLSAIDTLRIRKINREPILTRKEDDNHTKEEIVRKRQILPPKNVNEQEEAEKPELSKKRKQQLANAGENEDQFDKTIDNTKSEDVKAIDVAKSAKVHENKAAPADVGSTLSPLNNASQNGAASKSSSAALPDTVVRFNFSPKAVPSSRLSSGPTLINSGKSEHKSAEGNSEDACKRYGNSVHSEMVKENIRNARNKLEPLFRLNNSPTSAKPTATTVATFENGLYTNTSCSSDKLNASTDSSGESPFAKLSSYSSKCQPQSPQKQAPTASVLNLPLIVGGGSKHYLDNLEFDKLSSRELVGEPDGKADSSDDTSDPPSLKIDNCSNCATDPAESESTNATVFVNPQRSFLHGLTNGKEKPKTAFKPAPAPVLHQQQCATPSSRRTFTDSEPKPVRPYVTSTPNEPQKSRTVCDNAINSRSFTKRLAPPPPISSPCVDLEKLTTSASANCDSKTTSFASFIDGDVSVKDDQQQQQQRQHQDEEDRSSSLSSSTTDDKMSDEYEKIDSSRYYVTCDDESAKKKRYVPGQVLSPRKQNGFLYEKYIKRTFAEDCGNPTAGRKQQGGVTAGCCDEDRILSLSCDSITPVANGGFAVEKHSKRYNGTVSRVRCTLRKMLRLNSHPQHHHHNHQHQNGKDDEEEDANRSEMETSNGAAAIAMAKKKLEIIHPLDLNKSAVQVVKGSDCIRLNTEFVANRLLVKEESSKFEECFRILPSSVASAMNNHPSSHASTVSGRPSKPPPPPRSQSLDFSLKPMRPPPPRTVQTIINSADLSNKENVRIAINTGNCTNDNNVGHEEKQRTVYENLGESRQNIIPVKPQRSSSMRDKSKLSMKDELKPATANGIKLPDNEISFHCENEAVPECDRNCQLFPERKAFSDNVAKSVTDNSQTSSIIYCSSETESDIYYHSIMPCENEVISEHDYQLNNSKNVKNWKSRTVLHNSLEDNYGAVVIANHEALSQLLEQVDHATAVASAPIKAIQTQSSNVCWKDFQVFESSRISLGVDCKFYNAKWRNTTPVVISTCFRHRRTVRSLPGWITFVPVLEFTDRIPCKYVKNVPVASSEEYTQAYITVWNEEQIESISAYSGNSCTSDNPDHLLKATLIVIQLTYALKCLQACGIEEVSLDEFVICKEEQGSLPKLCILPTLTDSTTLDFQECSQAQLSLCKCTSFALNILLPNHKLTTTVQQILSDERASSLSQAKAVVEYWLWGPSADVNLSNDKLTMLQRWLDLERATLLHKLVCSRTVQLSTIQRYHLMFLVRTNAKMLSEASVALLNSSNGSAALVH